MSDTAFPLRCSITQGPRAMLGLFPSSAAGDQRNHGPTDVRAREA
jgi:hypothetical protein